MLRLLLLAWLTWLTPALAGSEAEALMLAGRVEQAVPVARAEAEAAPADLDAQERYIDLLLTVGLPGLADQVYRTRTETDATADDWYLLGRAVITAEQAAEAYEKALALDPAHARSYMGLGAVYRAVGAREEAAASYSKALQIDPKLAEAWAGLSAALLMLDRPADALEAARHAVNEVPGDGNAYMVIARLSPDEAEAILRQGTLAAPDTAQLHVALSDMLLERGAHEEARAAAQAALRIAPTALAPKQALLYADSMAAGALDGPGYVALMEARGARDPREALPVYAELVERYPKSPLPWMGRAQVRVAIGDGPGALEDLGKALALDPSNIDAMVATGLVLLDLGRASEARPLLARVADERPEDASLSVAAAMAEHQGGATDKALARLQAATERHAYDARLVLTYAKVLADSRKSQEAYRLLSDAAERMPWDDRVVLSLAAAAKDVGRVEEAALLLEAMAIRSGKPEFDDLARRLRAGEL